ncbi:uncharacterized protein LOC111258950 [Varroa jacobsoni]|uniref:Uncharacterized protein n=1 Tax=Varroa destructor TaxID=109461 RepID=A0A7M7KYT5_VARDE|nr:uncharacterized protein LOC111254689 [Varroa destructor]XP_022671531.1 uncharacterized protein LOC111254689 [Varroa destructor]XP_022671532.1 uncharacterized protein LOC111254689 [Varroa destructor]XP_022671533.1 uncharacterized protein LOC111254689 [Varroa destructor]XP_022671534.1 uncharacterized protein LOC111254689 [Varroa destructor]XP_022671537.1 uncharacterized protein LOC111254689 [Varroa destructor]XP_022686293.1 uncharacterized protein LOC111258950 [Varroa jacobsoni]XP_022686294
MPILDRCWNPLMMYHYTNVRFGSYYVAIYTTVVHVLFIFYAIYAMQGGRTDWFFSPYFEYSQKGTVTAASLTVVLCLLFLLFTLLLCKGVKLDNRCLYFPWMIAMSMEVLLMVGVGLWYIVRYYRNLFSVLAAILLWTIDGIHIYCLLVVISQYQIVKNFQEPKFEFLYP